MDSKQIRYKNARYLLKNEALGITDFSEKIGRSQSQTSAYISENPTKNIGDKIARIIEDAFDMPYGWLDEKHRETEVSDNIDKIANHNSNNLSVVNNHEWAEVGDLVADATNIVKKINKLRSDITELSKKKSSYASRLERLAVRHTLRLMEKSGCEILYLSEHLDDMNHYRDSEYARSSYDLIVKTQDSVKVGFCFWVIPLKQHRTPLPKIDIDINYPEIVFRLALYVVDNKDCLFFYLPTECLLNNASPHLDVNYTQEGGLSKMSHFTINNEDIAPLANSPNLQLSSSASTDNIRLIKEKLEKQLKLIDERLKK